MSSINIYSVEGSVVGKAELPDEFFAAKVVTSVIHDVVRAEETAARSGNADTKTRSDVSGGGKKPWKQKGTGRARHGSTRSPIWRKGGIVFGPHPRDYDVKVNKKTKKLALTGALSTRQSEERVIGIQATSFDAPKTAVMANFIKTIDINKEIKKPLFIHTVEEDVLIRSIRNIRNASHVNVENMSTRSVMVADLLILTPAAIAVIGSRAASDEAARQATQSRKAPDDPVHGASK